MRRTNASVPRQAVTLRPATLDDARLVFDCRNDAEAQENSLSTEDFSFDHHVNWMKPRLDETHPESIYIAEVKGQTIGYGRVNFLLTSVNGGGDIKFQSTGMISLVVSPAFRSMGYGKEIIKGLVAITKRARRIPLAAIKEDNIASRRAFEAVGFAIHHWPKAHEVVMYYPR